jgi:dolichol-phosphate mannosyltransferase
MLLGDSTKSTAEIPAGLLPEYEGSKSSTIFRIQPWTPSANQYRTPHIMTTPPDTHYSIVIPAYNEEHRISPLFDAIDQFDGELIVVCDGTDGTAGIVDRIAAQRKDLTIRCLRFDHRLGKGGGVMEGLRAAVSPCVGYFDADGSTSIDEMKRLFLTLSSADGAIGSRWIPGANLRVRQSVMRQMESRAFNLLIRILFGLNYHDTQCGAKVFKKSAIDAIMPMMVSRGFEFDVELLWRLRRAGFTVDEIPIEWQNKGDSHVRKRDMLGMLAGLFAVRFGSRRS